MYHIRRWALALHGPEGSHWESLPAVLCTDSRKLTLLGQKNIVYQKNKTRKHNGSNSQSVMITGKQIVLHNFIDSY
jgi:hypothetical protein